MAPFDAGVCLCPPATVVVRAEPQPAHVAPLKPCPAKDKLPLEAAREAFDAQQFDVALSCAAKAAALAPNDVLALVEKANALVALERDDEAKQTFAHALALDPDSIDALVAAAHFYVTTLAPSQETSSLGSLYAERGLSLAHDQHDGDAELELARVAAMAMNDLGRSNEAIERAEHALGLKKDDPDARHERALAYFSLCRFSEAKREYEKLLGDAEHGASAHHHVGLILEREGKQKEADAHLDKARALRPDTFTSPVLLSKREFQAELERAIAELPKDMRDDIVGVPIVADDLPDTADLTANDPPLAPTILGLFRGTPIGEACELEPGDKPGTPCRSVALYRKNLARAVKTRAELNEQIRVTLLHEVGHLRGEDDDELAARGLE